MATGLAQAVRHLHVCGSLGSHRSAVYPPGRVAGAGAASGAWFGLFFGLLITFFSITTNFIAITFAAIGIGAGFGIIFGLISYAITRRTRDFTSTHQVLASRYEVIVSPTITLAAQDALARPDAAA